PAPPKDLPARQWAIATRPAGTAIRRIRAASRTLGASAERRRVHAPAPGCSRTNSLRRHECVWNLFFTVPTRLVLLVRAGDRQERIFEIGLQFAKLRDFDPRIDEPGQQPRQLFLRFVRRKPDDALCF